jgi:CheY-like chemotaxis protein
VDKLSHGIQSLGREFSDVKGSTQGVRIPKDPPPSQIDELRQGGPGDERTRHTDEIERQTIIRHNERAQSQNEGVTSQRILVVEDNIINRRILSRKLCSLGFEIIEANDGQETLDAYQNSSLDCILMDQEMPVISGNSATRRIRELEKESGTHIPILGMTANVRAAQISEMLEAGMDDIINKPFRTEEIVAKINQFLPMALGMTNK